MKRSRQLTASEITLTAEWMVQQPSTPSWKEVRAFVLKTFKVNRSGERLRKIDDLRKARQQKKAAPATRRPSVKAPLRKIEQLEAEVQRLNLQLDVLKVENEALLERNIRLINGARKKNITEEQLEQPLGPVTRFRDVRER